MVEFPHFWGRLLSLSDIAEVVGTPRLHATRTGIETLPD